MDLLKKIFSKINKKKESKAFFNYRLKKSFVVKKSDSSSFYGEKEVGDRTFQDISTPVPLPTDEPISSEDIKRKELEENFSKVVDFVRENINIINDERFRSFSKYFINRVGSEQFPDEESYDNHFIKSTFSMLRDFKFNNFVFNYILDFDDVELYGLAENVSQRLGGVSIDAIYFLFECLKRKHLYSEEVEDESISLPKVVDFIKSNMSILEDDNFNIFARNFIEREGREEYKSEESYKNDFIKDVFRMDIFRKFSFNNEIYEYISNFNEGQLKQLSMEVFDVAEDVRGISVDAVYFLFECLKRISFYDSSIFEQESQEDKERQLEDVEGEEVKNVYNLYDIDTNIPHPGDVFISKIEELSNRDDAYPKGNKIGEAIQWYRKSNVYFNDAMSNVFYGVREGRGPYEIFNFFLEYPKYFQDILNLDPEFNENFKQFIAMGASKKNICQYIAMEKGSELLQRLNELIDGENIDIFRWVLKEVGALGVGEKYKKDKEFYKDEEGKTIYYGDEKDRIVEREDEAIGQKTEEDARRIATNVSYGLLRNNVKGTKEIKKNVFESTMDECINDFEQVEDVAEKRRILDKYTSYEIMNLHLKKTVEQFNLFLLDKERGNIEKQYNKTRGEKGEKIIRGVTLSNKYGKIYIDIQHIMKILMDMKRDPVIIEKYPEIEDYEIHTIDNEALRHISNIYEREYKKGDEVFRKSWSDVMTNRAVGENNTILYMVKKIILQNKGFVVENIMSDPSIVVKYFLESSSGYEGFRDDLMYVSGASKEDSNEEMNNKIFNFIKMTISQDKHGFLKDMYKYEEVNNLINENNNLEEQIKRGINVKQNTKKIKKNSTIIRKTIHDKRVRLMEYFRKGKNNVLYNLFKEKQEEDIDSSAMRSVVDSLYPPTNLNVYRTFTGEGLQSVEVKDEHGQKKELTHSEIYFYIRGEDIPEDINYLIDIYKRRDKKKYPKVTYYRKETDLLGSIKKNPYNNLFYYVGKVFNMDSRIRNKEIENEQIRDEIRETQNRNKIKKLEENKKKIEELHKNKTYYSDRAKEVLPFIKEDIPDLDLNKLKLAYLIYRNMMKKIALLRDMGKFKFASSYNIEEQIQQMYNDFDIFFKKLFI